MGILDDSVRAIWKHGMSVSKAFDEHFKRPSKGSYETTSFHEHFRRQLKGLDLNDPLYERPPKAVETKSFREAKKYEALFAMAVAEGYPPAVEYVADLIFAEGLLGTAEPKIENADIIESSRRIYGVFISFAIKRGAGVSK